jgi:HNH endonuclease
MARARKKGFPPGSACKPCWELKYCPYGPLVEFFPLHPEEDDIDKIREGQSELIEVLREGLENPEKEWPHLVEKLMYFRPDNWEYILQFDVDLLACREFGHVCPVFFMQEGFTETRETRRSGRYIPREIMLQVVRRDNSHCRACGVFLNDKDLRFDHVIPVSRGGPTSVDNLRLLCDPCNQRKSNEVGDFLHTD